MALDDVLYTKKINNEDEEDGAPCVVPKSRGGVSLVVPRCVEASFEDLVGAHISLGQGIDAFTNIEVYPSAKGVLQQIIFLDKLLQDVGEFDVSLSWVEEMGLEVNF